jgi:Putative beta-barrel porin-2, OmpL-like. bbp2
MKTEGRLRLLCLSLFTAAFLAMSGRLLAQTSADNDGANGSATSSSPVQGGTPDQHGFSPRLAKAYWDDWTGANTDSDEPVRRGYPAPVTSPPFPFSDWPYGGSPVIGAADTDGGPLMTALYTGENRQWWQNRRIKIYGWVNGGFNVSTSDKHYGNAPAAYYIQPNSVQLDQTALYIERVPDTVQTDHFDWGFRLTQLYGLDYRFTTAKGYFSQQLLKDNNKYGYDPVMAYVDLYWGQVADGMNVRIGRYISLPDIEAQLAPDNYTYSHSILYTYDAYTQTGINVTTKLNDHWMVQVGLSAGNDVAPWVGEPNAKPTFNGCVGYTWTEGRDNLYVCDNSTNSGKYAYNNLQAYYATWYHRFGTSFWHMATESWYMWEKNVPNVNNPNAASLLITGANGAICNSVEDLTCYAPEWAIVNYVEKQFSTKDYLTIRNEYFNDIRGQRTGYRTQYSEHLLGWGHWIGTSILIRPELRFEHSYDEPAYNLGTKKSQFVFASDVIYHF